MKAYMSIESSFRSYCELGSTDEHGTPLETVAEREARRILADVEPDTHAAFVVTGDPALATWNCRAVELTAPVREIIRESLAAFVAE